MSAESTIKTVLEADATLLALATGGIYSWDETGSEGINRTTTPDAWNSNGIMLPTIMVSARNAVPGLNVPDEAAQSMDVRQIVEIYFFQFDGYSTIDSMVDRCYALLHAKRLTGPIRMDWAGSVRLGRDIEFDANVYRADWQCVYIRSV